MRWGKYAPFVGVFLPWVCVIVLDVCDSLNVNEIKYLAIYWCLILLDMSRAFSLLDEHPYVPAGVG